MALDIRCANCGSCYKIDERFAGQSVRCKHCDNKITIPLPAPAEAAAPPVTTSYKRDLLRLALPVRSLGDAVTFILFTLIGLSLFYPFPFSSCFFLLMRIFLGSYLCSFWFKIITETADGNDHLPDLGWFDNIRDDIIHGFLLFLSGTFYVFLPALSTALAHRIIMGPGSNLTAGITIHCVLMVLIIIGLFFWPMVMLIMIWGEVYWLLRPDLIIRSIFTVLGAYFICWLTLLVIGGAWYLTGATSNNLAQIYPDGACYWLVRLVLPFVGATGTIYAMRTVGLLFRHYRHRLTWAPD